MSEMKIKIEKGNLIIDFDNLLYYCKATMTEDELLEIIEKLGWKDELFKRVADMLASMFSREGYNEFIHDTREGFLRAIKEEELRFYADKLAKIIETRVRQNGDYWNLYHEYRRKLGDIDPKWMPPQTASIDFDMRQELANMIEDALGKKVGIRK